MFFIVGDGVLDRSFLELTDYSVWMKFLKRKARIEAEFSQKASEWTKDVQKYMDSLTSEAWTGLQKMKKVVSHHVSHFREGADFFAKSAKIDKEAADNMRGLVYTNQIESTDLLECRDALNTKINVYLKCKTDMEKQNKKVDTALERLNSLATEMEKKQPSKRQRRAEKKSKSDIQKYRDLIQTEGEIRENLISLSGLYEYKVLMFACTKVDTFVITWKKFYLQYVSCESFLSKKTDDHYLTAYQEIVAIDTEKEATELLALSREIIVPPSIKDKYVPDRVVELLGFKPDFTLLNIPQPKVKDEKVEAPKVIVQELRQQPDVEELREMMWWLKPGPHVYPDLISALLDCDEYEDSEELTAKMNEITVDEKMAYSGQIVKVTKSFKRRRPDEIFVKKGMSLRRPALSNKYEKAYGHVRK